MHADEVYVDIPDPPRLVKSMTDVTALKSSPRSDRATDIAGTVGKDKSGKPKPIQPVVKVVPAQTPFGSGDVIKIRLDGFHVIKYPFGTGYIRSDQCFSGGFESTGEDLPPTGPPQLGTVSSQPVTGSEIKKAANVIEAHRERPSGDLRPVPSFELFKSTWSTITKPILATLGTRTSSMKVTFYCGICMENCPIEDSFSFASCTMNVGNFKRE